MKDFMTLYSGLVERCFMDCANDFTTAKLKSGEESCVNHCADKFLALSTRWVAVMLFFPWYSKLTCYGIVCHLIYAESDHGSRNTTLNRCKRECNRRIDRSCSRLLCYTPEILVQICHNIMMPSDLEKTTPGRLLDDMRCWLQKEFSATCYQIPKGVRLVDLGALKVLHLASKDQSYAHTVKISPFPAYISSSLSRRRTGDPSGTCDASSTINASLFGSMSVFAVFYTWITRYRLTIPDMCQAKLARPVGRIYTHRVPPRILFGRTWKAISKS